jgi:hypothetical protein
VSTERRWCTTTFSNTNGVLTPNPSIPKALLHDNLLKQEESVRTELEKLGADGGGGGGAASKGSKSSKAAKEDAGRVVREEELEAKVS